MPAFLLHLDKKGTGTEFKELFCTFRERLTCGVTQSPPQVKFLRPH